MVRPTCRFFWVLRIRASHFSEYSEKLKWAPPVSSRRHPCERMAGVVILVFQNGPWAKQDCSLEQSVYPPCTSNWRFGRFYRFYRFVESISYLESTSTFGSNPTLSASSLT